MPRHVTVEDREGTALVRIDRAPANAMDLELLEDGTAVLDGLAADPPDAIVLTGREGFFSAGVDLKLAPTLDARGQRDMVAGINRAFAGWYSFPRPVVCAVNGHAIAGGLILALCGDHRIGTGSGKLGLTELRAGVPYPAVAMAVVQAELSKAAARRLVLGSELIGMEEARDLQILDELVPDDGLLDRALTRAREMAEAPSKAYATVKRQLRGQVLDAVDGGRDDPLAEGWLGEDTAGAARGLLDA
jgi:enoyl-CoA hydratase